MDGTPTLVLVNYRPEHTPAWSESTVYETIDLQPLNRDDTAQLLCDIIGCDPSLDGIDEPTHERTDGRTPGSPSKVPMRTLIHSGCLSLRAKIDEPQTLHNHFAPPSSGFQQRRTSSPATTATSIRWRRTSCSASTP